MAATRQETATAAHPPQAASPEGAGAAAQETDCGPARAALGRSDVLTIRGSRFWLDGRTFAVIGFR